jgi:DNA-binding transcriptional LysR family regulator
MDEAEAQLSETALALSGTLKVSMPVWMANPSFARILAAFHEENPDVILDLDLSSQNINLVEEGVDLALRVAMTLDDGLIARTLTEVEFPLLASPALLDKVGRPNTIDDLSDSSFLISSQMGPESRIRYGQGPDALDIKFTPVLKTDNETLINLAAREGMGFLPHWLAKDDLAEGLLEPFYQKLLGLRFHYAIYPDRSYLPAKVRSFLDFLSGPNGLGKL